MTSECDAPRAMLSALPGTPDDEMRKEGMIRPLNLGSQKAFTLLVLLFGCNVLGIGHEKAMVFISNCKSTNFSPMKLRK